MRTHSIFAGLFFLAAAASAQEALLSIEPDPYVSSDSVTIGRVVARNPSPHTIDGRTIVFEARAWENGVLVSRERGRFSGAVPPGGTAETRIGFNGPYLTLTVVSVDAKEPGRRSGNRRGGRSASRSPAKKGGRAKSSSRKRASR